MILAGGGLKVAFQAGVLQVWLDEAGLEFDLADGASGGTFNLAMLCQGMSGREIADAWRALPGSDAIDLNWRRPLLPMSGESLGKLDRLRSRVFARWGLDWEAIRASPLEATFNAYNFTRHELAVVTPDRMSEDMLVACVSLPMWFPPVRIDGETYTDSVFATDANLEEAIRRGADELWVVWTVSEHGEWHPGFIGGYFGIVETAANSSFRRVVARIEESNAAIAAGESGEFGRVLELKVLRSEVPLHYLLNVNPDRFTQAVERGVDAGRRWCAEQGIALRAPVPRSHETAGGSRLRFSETMSGLVTFGETDFERGARPGRGASELSVRLAIAADDLERFMRDPRHEARSGGEVRCEELGGRLPIEHGTFNLFVDESDPAHKRMLYRLFFRDGVGHPLTLAGFKVIETETGRGLWRDTTTLYTRVLKGHVQDGVEEGSEIVAAGVIRIGARAFLRQLTTFRADAGSPSAGVIALARFGVLFLGGLWDVYGRRVLAASPF